MYKIILKTFHDKNLITNCMKQGTHLTYMAHQIQSIFPQKTLKKIFVEFFYKSFSFTVNMRDNVLTREKRLMMRSAFLRRVRNARQQRFLYVSNIPPSSPPITYTKSGVSTNGAHSLLNPCNLRHIITHLGTLQPPSTVEPLIKDTITLLCIGGL